ncbi:DUF5682 family protein [Actinoplanes sp. TRM 88003]|uniref:DUF5682 family protein n=1 Tax=Paractinoplanes aksuensis TaxID=2939490 RepID=A0ABT1DQT0_9ACTN|nr:DUF5682 family protein [Actinoplanes aksuensis]MCO8273165.1 DUF5682 family protein [Actinoplanes aksuensis]
MPERLYGIRHHGPGSARAVVAELERQPPEVLLVEGPPEADSLVRWVADAGLEPPVALLGYASDDPRRAAFWPFAVFSPEWQAIRWAVERGVPVRFFDLPFAYRLTGEARPAPRPSPSLPGAPAAASPGGPDAPAPGPGDSRSQGGAPGSVPSTAPDTLPSGGFDSHGDTPGTVPSGGPDTQGDIPGAVPSTAPRALPSGGPDSRSGIPSAGPDATPPGGSDTPHPVPSDGPGRAPSAAHPDSSTPAPHAAHPDSSIPPPHAAHPDGSAPAPDAARPGFDGAPGGVVPGDGGAEEPAAPVRPVDPIGELAAAAGYDDPERWWEDVVEHRGMPAFEAIAEAMTAIRDTSPEDPDDLVREAYMRTVLREVRKTYDDIAVVCGAWHVPALTRKVAVKDDTALLKGRKKAKVDFTWVPWTYGRLASWSGYGAGVNSPGWYHHLFTSADEVVPRWLVDAAGVLRAEGVPTSSAHVIEATRLAEALATLRGRPLAGLAEVTEAAESVMCDGEPLRVELITRKLVVGERLGGVPDDMPAVPLAKDLAAQQRTTRLKPEALERNLDLDLRKETDLRRSRLLHRLRTIGVPWGEGTTTRGSTGTFREEWKLRWQPEFAIRLVEGSMYGTTVAAAATAKVVRAADQAETLADVTALVETCLLADLADAYPRVLAALDTRAALDADVNHLMAAIPALARTLRYGDVRQTDVAGLADVTASLLSRVCAGLPSAVGSLSDEAAKVLRDRVDGVHTAVGLLDDADLRERWMSTLASLSGRADLHGLLAGRLTRLLLDAGRLDGAEVRRRLRLPLTVGTPPAHAAAWVEGFLSGGGLLLVHDDALLSLLDDWLADIPAEAFDDVLPLLRRTFGAFEAGERRAIGERLAGPRAAGDETAGDGLGFDPARADLVLPTLTALLGRPITATGEAR